MYQRFRPFKRFQFEKYHQLSSITRPSGNALVWTCLNRVVAVAFRYLCLFFTYLRGSLNHNLEHPHAFHRLSVETPIEERRSYFYEGVEKYINEKQLVTQPTGH